MKTPNLEKRLYGLGDIKEIINLSVRKQEYLESVERAERKTRPGQGTAASALCASSQASCELLVEWLLREQARRQEARQQKLPVSVRSPVARGPRGGHRSAPEQVVELIFGEGLHDQLVRRCVEARACLSLFSVRHLGG